MGGYTWPGYATRDLLDDITTRILEPTLSALRAQGTPYTGVLYAGLMLTRSGPHVLEFNCRFGDPECQLILPLLATNLSEVCESVVAGRLLPETVRWRDGRTYGVVLAARGYPNAPETGETVWGLEDVPKDVFAFHAGTRVSDDGRVVTAGGRVLTLVGFDRETVYRAAAAVRFVGKQFRGDVGAPAHTLLELSV
jgi:phosphoribosylamine--glycine ligase